MAWFKTAAQSEAEPAGEAKALVAAPVIVLEKPRPIQPHLDPLTDMSEYEAVAKTLNFQPAQLKERKREILRRELIEFCLDRGFPIYSNDEVHKYMSGLAEEAGKKKYSDSERAMGGKMVFFWAPLSEPTNTTRERGDEYQRVLWDQRNQLARLRNANTINWTTVSDGPGWDSLPVWSAPTPAYHGAIGGPLYTHAVPLEMLKRGAAVKEKFPDAEIYVSHYAVVNPDPFIMAKRGDAEHVVFGVWDEPGFGLK